MNKEFKRYLQARQKALESKKAELSRKSTETEDPTELKSILSQLESLSDELSSVITELQNAEEDKKDSQEDTNSEDTIESDTAERYSVPKTKQTRGFNPMGLSNTSSIYDSIEYRTAFMEYVCRGVAMPTQYRDNPITTTDGSVMIPTTVMNEIIRELDTYGNIYSQVRKLNVQGGVEFPILSLSPEASWINETTTPESQKVKVNTSVSFKYFGVECKIAQTLLCNVVTLQAFEQLFVPLATEAIIKAVEKAIFNGDGTTQPLGILKDERVTNVIELTETEISSWEDWHKKVFAKMKKSYRTGTFIMAQGTFDAYIDGMVDSTGQPIARVNYGITDGETYRFAGKTVETVEDDLLPSWDDAQSGDIVAVFIKLDNYAINSNLAMTVEKWKDPDTNQLKSKCMMILDGKLLDPNGVILIKKAE